MNTSYFAKYKGENAVSIAGKAPDWYKGREYKKLAPKYWFFKAYKDGDITEEEYTLCYYKEILGFLNPETVYKELGENAVLLCWEKSGFCHRHIVARWLEKELGIEIKEL